MKLTFLGTGAADWDINAFRSDAPFRRNSSVLINDDLLIDPGPHIFHFAEHNGTPDMFQNVKNLIVTHSHGDHFDPWTVAELCRRYGCTLWADKTCMAKLTLWVGEKAAGYVNFRETDINLDYQIGQYTVTPLRANHATEMPDETPRIYLVQEGDRILYYGCDSSWIPTTSWNIIREKPVNAMVLELTCGETAPDDWRSFEHNTLDMLKLMLKMFRKYDRFAPDVKYYVSHLARTLHTDHETLEKTLEPLGVKPAYDGLTIEI